GLPPAFTENPSGEQEFVLAFGSPLVILAGTIRQWCRGIVVIRHFRRLTALSGTIFPASSACFRWHDTPGCEHFLSKDSEKVGETGSAIWPDWGVDPWRSWFLSKDQAGSEKGRAVADDPAKYRT